MLRRVVHRLAMLTAIVAVTGALFTPCQAGPVLNTPAGLTPGDTFRFVFVTDGTTTATSSSISTYDTFVNTQADGATYNGSTISWLAIGSTPTVDAITHDGVNPSISGVYLVNGTQIATGDGTGTGGLWWGSLLQAPPDVDINSSIKQTDVWTGSESTGIVQPGNGLGDSSGASVAGNSSSSDDNWSTYLVIIQPGQNNLYGISSVLTVPTTAAVPEPSSGLMAVFGIAAGLVLAWTRKGQEPRRQGPVGPPDEIQ
jgi:PEP-CTERM motif